MKKAIFIGLFIMTTLFGSAYAQDCEYIVAGKYHYNMELVQQLPRAKVDYHCRFSRNNLFVTNEVPRGAKVYSITELKNQYTGDYLPSSFVVNLDSISYYAYDFAKFQDFRYNESVYFSTPGSQYHYLGLRAYRVACDMTGETNVEMMEEEMKSKNDR